MLFPPAQMKGLAAGFLMNFLIKNVAAQETGVNNSHPLPAYPPAEAWTLIAVLILVGILFCFFNANAYHCCRSRDFCARQIDQSIDNLELNNDYVELKETEQLPRLSAFV